MTAQGDSGTTVRVVAIAGSLAGLSVLLAFVVRFPILAVAPFLLYEPSDVPLLIAAFRLTPGWVAAVAAVVALLVGLVGGGGIIGMVSRFVGTTAIALTAALVCRRLAGRRLRRLPSVGAGVAVYTVVEILLTIALGPVFFGDVKVALGMILPVVVPFNLIKGSINGLIALVVDRTLDAVIIRRGA